MQDADHQDDTARLAAHAKAFDAAVNSIVELCDLGFPPDRQHLREQDGGH